MLNIFKNVIFVEMKISKLFSYSRNMHQSCQGTTVPKTIFKLEYGHTSEE
jgi:hypothetical protein